MTEEERGKKRREERRGERKEEERGKEQRHLKIIFHHRSHSIRSCGLQRHFVREREGRLGLHWSGLWLSVQQEVLRRHVETRKPQLRKLEHQHGHQRTSAEGD